MLHQAFEALDDHTVPLQLIKVWFSAQITRLSGHTPNLQTDEQGRKLVADQLYDFDSDHMRFVANPLEGSFTANHIKFLRLLYAGNTPKAMMQVQGLGALLSACSPLVEQR